MKKIVIAADSFKGSASSSEVADYLERGLQAAGSLSEITKVPLADGGEGTVTAIIKAASGRLMSSKVSGPAGGHVEAQWGLLPDHTAVIEMAAAAGFTQDRDQSVAVKSTFGVGELIKQALDYHATTIYIGLGGSSTNDGGVGMAQALGGRFYDQNGSEVPRGIAGLRDLVGVNLEGLDSRLQNVQVIGLADVDNPLTGKNGATQIFGPQKGVRSNQVAEFDKRLNRLSQLTTKVLGTDYSTMPGAGAAGGLGFGVLAFLGGRLTSGIAKMIEIVHLQAKIQNADLVITGEGRIDQQTLNGKLPLGVAQLAHKAGVPTIAVAGSVSGDVQPLYEHGFDLILSTTTSPMTVDEAIQQAPQLTTQVRIPDWQDDSITNR